MWALPGRRPKLTSQSLGRLKKPEVDVFPSSSITHCEPDNFSASTRLGFQSTSLSSGYKHALRREEGKGGPCGGPPGHLARRGLLKGPSQRSHGRCVQGHALPKLRGHERVSGEGGGDLPAHQVTRPGSQLRFSAPHVSSLGPGAGPHSGGWQSQGRRHTGCAGRPRSPLKSARSQHPASAGCGHFL